MEATKRRSFKDLVEQERAAGHLHTRYPSTWNWRYRLTPTVDMWIWVGICVLALLMALLLDRGASLKVRLLGAGWSVLGLTGSIVNKVRTDRKAKLTY